ncbi:MAG: hypothetical protein VX438_02480 [Planctomycetota bacterium]|nr:hypothetical protein [Planctomycetota bacterium]
MNYLVHRRSRIGRCLTVQVLFTLSFFAIPVASQDDDLARIKGLRQRRLFDLCLEQVELAKLNLTEKDFHKKVVLEIERLKTQAAKAFEEESQVRLDSVQSLLRSASDFVFENSKNPNIVLIEVQKEMTKIRFGELLRKEIEAGAVAGEREQTAFQMLRDADRQFEVIDKKLGELIPGREKKTGDDLLSQLQLISLQNQVRYQKIKSMINRALLYGSSDPENKIAVLSTSKTNLEKLIPLIETVDAAWWEARLDLLFCLRVLGEYRGADLQFKSYPVEDAKPLVKLAFKAERLRLAIAQNQVKQAELLISSGRQVAGSVSPDFDFAILEYCLYKLSTVDQAGQAGLRKSAIKMVDSIGDLHGTYWGRRANLALISAVKATGSGGSATFIRVAQEYYRKKNYEQSILEFEKAAKEELNRNLELELWFQAIAIHRSLNQHAVVLKKAISVSRQFKDTERSAVIHLIGILSAAQMVRENRYKAQDYVGLLDFHLRQWPGHPTVGKVAQFRGEYDFQIGNFTEAALQFQRSILALFNGPMARDPNLLNRSCSRLSACFERLAVAEPTRAKKFSESFQGKVFFELTSKSFDQVESWLNCWSSYGLEIDSTARLNAMTQLKKVSTPSFHSQELMIRLAAATGNPVLVAQLVENWNAVIPLNGNNPEGSNLLIGLERDWRRHEKKSAVAIATAVTRVRCPDPLKVRFAALIADCFVKLNLPKKAKAILKMGIQENPKSKTNQMAFARLLVDSADETEIQQGLGIWRKVLAQSPRQTDDWFEAKYRIAEAYTKLGETERSRTLLELLQAVPPGWEQSKFSGQFEALLNSVSTQKR